MRTKRYSGCTIHYYFLPFTTKNFPFAEIHPRRHCISAPYPLLLKTHSYPLANETLRKTFERNRYLAILLVMRPGYQRGWDLCPPIKRTSGAPSAQRRALHLYGTAGPRADSCPATPTGNGLRSLPPNTRHRYAVCCAMAPIA